MSLSDQKNLIYRDATIQRFEYTYELFCSVLDKALSELFGSSAIIKQMTFKDKIREANDRHLLEQSVSTWDMFRQARNSTNHNYDEKFAEKVYLVIGPFIKETRYLIKQFDERF